MQQIDIPTHADEPQIIILWTTDEFIPVAVLFILGILVEQLLVCSLIGFGFSRFYRRYKADKPDGYLLHLCYASGLLPSKGLSFRNPFATRWLP